MGQSRSYGGFQGEANLDKIAVLIPCYNEEKTVEKVVRDFRQVLPEAVIYVYDNNSSDRTVELAEKAGAVVRHEYLQGKGNVIRRMFREIDAEVYIMTDGDDTYPAEFAREMVEIAFLLRILRRTSVRSIILEIHWCAARSTSCSTRRSRIS